MRSGLWLLLGACGLLGCVSFPSAHLLQGRAGLEVVRAPVVCGPVGFRKVPLQSRWGEYVRVTVAAPASLRGTVLVHADGVSQEPQSWSTESTGALVAEVRFPNEDVERLFALGRERPIDITLTGLEGVCEGAVFTVEHGALVPSVDERAWVAELERRGGPELAARREAARLAAEARRQAHYASWESRQVEVSAELIAQASVIREQHYAQWEARGARARGGEGRGGGATVFASADLTAAPACASDACTAPGLAAVTNASPCVSGTCGALTSSIIASVPCANDACAAPGLVPATNAFPCVSGTCGALASSIIASAPCAGGSCTSASCAAPGFAAGANTAVPTVDVVAIQDPAAAIAVTSPGEWTQPSDLSLRASAAVPSPDSLRARIAIESGWSQPFDARLEPVAVTTESQVVTRGPNFGFVEHTSQGAVVTTESQVPTRAPNFGFVEHTSQVAVTTDSQVATREPIVVPSCSGDCAPPEEPVLPLLVPALFQVMFNIASAPPPPQVQHGARSLPPGGR